MAQNPPGPKAKWGVGSFFSQAVAGVESRLDNILTEGEEIPQHIAQAKAKQDNATRQGVSPARSSGNISRSSSNARKNDRLQERLARAVVKQNAAGHARSPSAPNRITSPVPSGLSGDDARSSLDAGSSRRPSTDDNEGRVKSPTQESVISAGPRASQDSGTSSQKSRELVSDVDVTSSTNDTNNNGTARLEDDSRVNLAEQIDENASEEPAPTIAEPPLETPKPTTDDETTISQMQADHKAAESRWQEEMHGYIERIDALQSKLKYLAKEAADSAKSAAASAEPGTVERQTREKDEKIALLLEEGQKLSKSEFDHRNAIKKLRQQMSENSKSHNEANKKREKLERDLADSEARAKRAEAAEKRANELVSSQAKASRDLEAVTSERDTLSETVQDLKFQLSRTVFRADAAESKVQSDALEQERSRASELEETLASVRIEHEISEDKLRREVSDLKGGIDQEKERARMLETELKNEQSVLESKMEGLRSRAEEASSGATGDAQAKLLRQIEMLQTQYSVASENWQTLEGSLLSRLGNVEKERDEVARREGDMRRKIREVNLKAKKTDEELENAREIQHELESKIEERVQEIQKLELRLKKAADDLESAKDDMAEQKKISDATWTQRLEEERARYREQIPPTGNFLHHARNGSPAASSRRPSGLEPTGSLPSEHRPTSRRSSMIPASPDVGTPPRQNSYHHVPFSPQVSSSMSNPPIMEPPSITFDPDEFEDSRTPATPSVAAAQTHHSRGINDIISESTVGAGPSVQLVERMSATVRRLESEREASKDELARITAQRDEARQQVVDQMREVEEKKASDTRVQELESRIQELDQRYQTTLEMLGEKSELVEELQADIADLKKIYRELVDSTMK